MSSNALKNALNEIFRENSSNLHHKIIGLYSLLILFNILAWVWAFSAFHAYPILMGTALMAYGFGLRHAVDADHIAAIDNVTRKFVQDGRRPVSIGLMFSLGHSTIVIVMTAIVALTHLALQHRFEAFKSLGSITGTVISTIFLLVIAFINFISLIGIIQGFRRVRTGQTYNIENPNTFIFGGILSRLFKPMFKLISKSWHMYFLGLLFSLGFDTATEIGLMGISAASSSQGISIWSIMVFPTLFTAGMTLIDTTDSIMMLGAYGWAFIKPIRKIYYNMTITILSIVVALTIAGIEGLGLIGDKLEMKGIFWNWIGSLNDNFGAIGYAIISLFLVCWIISLLTYKWLRLDSFEVKVD